MLGKGWVKLGFIIGLTSLSVSLISCKKNEAKADVKPVQTSFYIAKDESTVTHLYYKGTINPIRTTPVLAPVDGRIAKIFFSYGANVKKDQTLLTIQAAQLSENYRTAVSDYLQKKSQLESQRATFEGDKALYNAGVMSKQDFINAKNTYQTSVLSFYQAQAQLEKILKQVHMSVTAVEKLKLGQTEAINALLAKTFSNIAVNAPADGVALIPTGNKSENNDDSKSNLLTVGQEVKALSALLSVGDLSGYQIQFQVSELNVTQIQAGLAAYVTGDAFPGITLKGYVKQVAYQANPSQGAGDSGGMSMFNIIINVPNVSPEESKNIRIGMTAKVEIPLKNSPKIVIPINAVFTKDNQSMVTVVDPNTGLQKEVPVQTGMTTLDKVEIIKGIKSGDKVVVREGDK